MFCGIPQQKQTEMEAQQAIAEITVKDLKEIIDAGASDYVIIDVRNPNEWEIGKIPNTVLVPLPEIENGNGVEKVKALLGDKKLIAHCKLGGRSMKALGILKQAGLEGINVQGGINAWSEQVDPSIPKY
jgi:adenylyltransferase/sulfurtransferase